ncbi:hypothetical protein INR49_022713, partial [Caranx melampygus]
MQKSGRREGSKETRRQRDDDLLQRGARPGSTGNQRGFGDLRIRHGQGHEMSRIVPVGNTPPVEKSVSCMQMNRFTSAA